MSSPDPLAVLEIAARNELELMLLEFDESWKQDSLDQYGERLVSHPDKNYQSLALAELVKIDLQRCWATGNGRLIEEYLRQFPLLGNAESISVDLIAAEYDARNGIDPNFSLASYEPRFPKQFEQVEQLAARPMDSGATASTPTKHAAELQASIDTSRIEQILDTKDGKRGDRLDELPIEFGRYRILKELGAGAMGKVYLAHDSQLDRQVALKTPSFSGSDNDDLVTRFYREARAAAKLQHRNICPIYDVGEIDGRHFISMAFVKGRCMSDFIGLDKLPPQRTSAILVQRLAVALSEAHKHNVIHRDLKPANIMIDLKKEPIVMDFGLARQTDVESRVTQSGMAVGTPAYMSPEQVRGELDEVGAGADIYALGVILYELLTGRLPFRGPIAKVVYGIVNEEPPPPSSIRKEIDSELESICAKMMAKDSAVRFQSMDDVAHALKTYVRGGKETGKPKASLTANDTDSPSSTSSSETLTETGALNAFFAAHAEATASGTQIEPSRPLVRTEDPKPEPPSARTSPSRNGNGRRPRGLFIATGFAGGFLLLLGVVIYFKGGKIELDDDSDAVVHVDPHGNVAVEKGRSVDSSQSKTVPHTQSPLVTTTPTNVDSKIDLEPGFVPLFNANNLDGWNGLADRWDIRDGEIQGTAPAGIKLKSNTVLCSEKEYENFELRFESMLSGDARKDGPNSGVQFRSELVNRTEYRVAGPQLDIGGRFWAGLWGEGTTGLMYQSNQALVASVADARDWNRYRLRVEGDRVTIHLNETQIVDKSFAGMPKSGMIGFQLHRGKVMTVRFRNVRIKELEAKSSVEPSAIEPPNTLQAAARPLVDRKIELLNEWAHGGQDSPDWHLASLSPDGRRVAFRFGDGPLQISNTDSAERLDIPAEMQDAISLAFSSDGRLIATGHGNKKIRLWDAHSFAPVGEPFESPIEQKVLWVHLSADGTKLIAMGNDHDKLRQKSTFHTWEIESRKLISRFQVNIDTQRWATSVDASADGTLVAVIGHRAGPTLWNTTTGKQVPVDFEFDSRVASMMRITGMDLSSDGSRLAYGTLWGGPSYAAVLDTATGKEIWNSGRQNGRVHCVQFSSNGKRLATTAGRSKAHQVSLWEVATGDEIERWEYQYDSDTDKASIVKFLSFANDESKLLLAGGYMPVVVWSLFNNATEKPQ